MLIYDAKIPLLGANNNAYMCYTCSPKDIYKNVYNNSQKNVYNSTIWSSPQVETAQMFSSGMDSVIYSYSTKSVGSIS